MASERIDKAVADAIVGSGCTVEDVLVGIAAAREASECRRMRGPCTCGMHRTPAPRAFGEDPARTELLRLREIVCDEDADAIDRALAEDDGGWTYCHDRQPPEAGVYDVAHVAPVSRADGEPMRPITSDPPPLTPEARSHLLAAGVPAAWLREKE